MHVLILRQLYVCPHFGHSKHDADVCVPAAPAVHAAGGRAILTTIHQPSSRLYRQLDQVMLLAEGHVMYYGDALKAVDWFDHLGFGLPYGTNLAGRYGVASVKHLHHHCIPIQCYHTRSVLVALLPTHAKVWID